MKTGVFWDAGTVHPFREKETEQSRVYDDYLKGKNPNKKPGQWIYKYKREDAVPFETVEAALNQRKDSVSKCEYLIQLNQEKTKNRFVHS